MTELKDRIKDVRTSVGLTQADFGSIIGISGPSVSQWEHGYTKPDERSIRLICKEFGVNYGWLIRNVGPKYKEDLPKTNSDIVNKLCKEYGMTSPKEIRLVETFVNLSHEQRLFLIDTVEKLLGIGDDKTQSK